MERLNYSVLVSIFIVALLKVIGLSTQDTSWWILCVAISGLTQFIYTKLRNET